MTYKQNSFALFLKFLELMIAFRLKKYITMYEGVNVEHTDAGDECVVVFEQKMDMQGGEYLLSFGCTGYRNGDFTVFHRLYDACNITVVSSKNTVGFYDMNSKVWIEE